MADMTPSRWLQEIHDAREAHFSEDRITRWRMAAEYHRSGACVPDIRKAYWNDMASQMGTQEIRINITQAIIENFLAALLPEELKSSVMPRRPGSEDAAWNVQNYINSRVIDEAGLEAVVERVAQYAAIFSDGFLKIGYIGAPKRHAGMGVEDLLEAADDPQLIGGDFEFDDEAMFRGDIVCFSAEYPWNIIPAPGASRMGDSPYIIHRMRKRFQDVVNNSNYDEKARNVLVPMVDSDLTESEHPYKDSEMLSVREDTDARGPDYIDLFEIWDIQNQEFRVVAAGNPDIYLRSADWPFPGLEGYPFEHLGFKPDPESFFHNSMIGDFADLQEELNVTSALMLESLKRSVPFICVNSGMLRDDTQRQRIANAQLYEIIEFDGKPSEALDIFPKGGSFSPDLYGVRNSIIQAILLVTGQSDFLIGQSQKTKSATEVAASSQGHTARINHKRKMFTRFLRNVLRKSYQITRHRMTTEQWVRTVGPDGANMVLVTPDDVRAELDVDVDVNVLSDRSSDPVRMKIVTDAMALLMNPALITAMGMNPVELGKKYLRAIGEKDIDKIQPMSAKTRDPAVENLSMSEGMEVEVHPLDDDMTHLQAHIEAQNAAEPGKHVVFQLHIKKHVESLQAKQQAMMQAQAMAGGGGQKPTTGANEAPSRTSAASDQGNTNARVFQGANNQ